MPASRLRSRPGFARAATAVAFFATLAVVPSSPADDTPLPAAPPAVPDIETLPDVVVRPPLRQPVTSASPLGPVAPLEATQPVGSLTGAALRYRTEGSIGATLSHEPGVSSTSFGPGAGRPVIRGQGGERIRVLENGIGTLDVSGLSDDHAVPVDPTTVERVEVVRGPATLRYGASAIGGVVYAHDGRIPETPVGRTVTGRAGVGFGTADDERSGFVVATGQHGAWNWRAAGFGRSTDDIDIPGFAKSRRQLEAEGNPAGVGEAHGTLPNSYARAEGGTLGLSWIVPRGFVGASVGGFSTDYGTPNEPDVHIEMQRLRFDAHGAWDHPWGGLQKATWALAFADYEHTEFEGPDPGTVFDQQAGEGRAEFVHCPWGCLEGAFGFQGSHTDLAVTGEEALLPHARTSTGAFFVDEQVHLSPTWTLEVGGRYDLAVIDSVGDRTFHAFSAAVGLVWKPRDDVSWALSTAYTERAPTAFELFANGPHVATEAFEVGDPDLGLERALGLDLSYRADRRFVTTTLTAFVTRYPSFIALVPTGAIDPGSGLQIFDYRQHEAALYGGEAQAAFHVWRCCDRSVDVEVLGDVVHGTNLTSDEPLPRIPPLRLGGGVVYRDSHWTARVDVLHAFDQDRIASNELATDGYTLLDAGVSYSRTCGCRTWTASVKATNLLDDEVRYHTSFIKDFAPDRGRSVRFSLELDF